MSEPCTSKGWLNRRMGRFLVIQRFRNRIVARHRALHGDSATLREWTFEIGDRRSSLLIYRAVHAAVRAVLHPYLRVRAENAAVLDRPGAVVLAPVHRSHLDTVLIATVCRRRLRALGKESLFTTPVVRYLCAALGAIPVRRGTADREALKAARELLDRGEPLFVFPEGGRFGGATDEENNTVQPLFDGAAWLSSRTGAPIVPIGVAGTSRALGSGASRLRRATVHIVVGEPLPPPSAAGGGRAGRTDLTEYTLGLRRTLQDLQDRAVAGAASRD